MVERRVVFPVIGDDEALQKDTRVIFTNQQLLTRNPSLQDEASIENNKPKTDAKRPESFKPYKAKTSFSTQHRPLNSNHDGVSSYDKMPKKLALTSQKNGQNGQQQHFQSLLNNMFHHWSGTRRISQFVVQHPQF